MINSYPNVTLERFLTYDNDEDPIMNVQLCSVVRIKDNITKGVIVRIGTYYKESLTVEESTSIEMEMSKNFHSIVQKVYENGPENSLDEHSSANESNDIIDLDDRCT